MSRLQAVVFVLVILLFIYIIALIKRQKMDLRYSLPWMAICLIVAVIDVFPKILEWLAGKLGMRVPSNMVFLVAIVLMSLRMFYLTASVSRLSGKNTRLTQEIALLRGEINESKDNCKDEEESREDV